MLQTYPACRNIISLNETPRSSGEMHSNDATGATSNAWNIVYFFLALFPGL